MEGKTLLGQFLCYLGKVKPIFSDKRVRRHVCEMGVASMAAATPKTITSLIEFNARHGSPELNHDNWSASYKVLSHSKWKTDELSWVLFDNALQFVRGNSPVILAVDDTLHRKTGKKVAGCAYARDPLSPPFQANLVWGQRMLCVSMLVRSSATSAYRSLPLFYQHSPVLKIAKKELDGLKRELKELEEEQKRLKDAPDVRGAKTGTLADRIATLNKRKKELNGELSTFMEQRKKSRISAVARDVIGKIRNYLDGRGQKNRQIIVCADGSFANRAFLYDVPHDTLMVCRCRNDLRLVRPLSEEEKTGKRLYGEQLPTPEMMHRDAGVAECSLECGVMHQHASVTYKSMQNVRWPTALKNQPCSIYAIKGQYYRKYGNTQHTHPAFLVVTGNIGAAGVTPETLLEAYLLRWEIEVGFRDQKNWLGIGKAQVRNESSVKRTPAFMSACYSMLLMSSMKVFDDKRTEDFAPLPKWRNIAPLRPSIRDLVSLLRAEVIGIGSIPA